jgi:hypothetical protein
MVPDRTKGKDVSVEDMPLLPGVPPQVDTETMLPG